ncbi:MAG TPA: hypothetical protein VK735_27665 [Pseudonocardia sp.]|jgi:DNA-binding NarL/FixJ family response regulator|uniref:hypothetical protein n=1 Tax=Pseudonocardia sp. TaxID=60912 RepID=UPI002C75B14A|nr:hypothetical protein [Pseudonocardia sp.]HTF51237.1 hypothetical protein [Pseudonocardia sp.]
MTRLLLSAAPRTLAPAGGNGDQTPGPTAEPILIVGGHLLFNTALRMALRAEDIDAHQIPVTDSSTILATTSQFPDGLVLLDLTSCDHTTAQATRGAELVTALRRQGKRTVLLSGGDHEPATAAAITAGAIGTLPLSLPFESVLDTLARAATGQEIMTEIDRQR